VRILVATALRALDHYGAGRLRAVPRGQAGTG
jgi:hypothetical protein